jgi:hypothetical protein
MYGKWSGYKARFEKDGKKYEAETFVGVRGIDIPVRLIIENGQYSMETKNGQLCEVKKFSEIIYKDPLVK